MHISRLLLIAALALPWSTSALAQHWGYSGEAGPENWANVDPKFVLCELGRNQSPVDLTGFVEADLTPLDFDYSPGTVDIVNSGHTVQVDYAAGSTLTVAGRSFELKQFHFHSPSENHIDGKPFPLEAHFVHADDSGNLAVVAVMFEEGHANSMLGQLWAKIPATVGEKAAFAEALNAADLLPATRHDYYRFNGSLTTPPCSEGVWWLVIKKPATVSKAQVEQFSSALGFANNRPIHPVNARAILK